MQALSASFGAYILRPFRYLIGSRQPGAGSRTCQAYGVRSNLRHVPSDEGARDLGKTRFSEVFGRARVVAIADPRRGKGVKLTFDTRKEIYILAPTSQMNAAAVPSLQKV